MSVRDPESSRRRFLQILVAAPLGAALGARLHGIDPAAAETWLAAAAGDPVLAPTPECGDDDEPTPPETEGPFFKPRSPLRKSLVGSAEPGTRIEVVGRVFGRDCRPLAGALLDFWHADDAGEYDNEGYRMRGHQFADAEGRYRLTTVVPGLYPGRTRHVHVKVQPKGGRILTTQLYFPDETRNRRDGLFRPELLVTPDRESAKLRARFHFILDAS